MSVKLLTEHHLEFLCLKGSCKGWSESTLVKMPHCWKSRVTAQLWFIRFRKLLLMSLKYSVFEISMENGAFASLEQMLHFP